MLLVLRLGALRPHRKVKLLVEFSIPRTVILVVAKRMFLDNDSEPSTFLRESESMFLFGEASVKDLLVSRAGRAEIAENARTLEGIAYSGRRGAYHA